MINPPFKSTSLVDYLFDFSKGVNGGVGYNILPRDQLASATNTTVRGSFVGPRPRFRKIAFSSEGYAQQAATTALETGRFQFGCYYKPDSGTESLMVSISGHLYRLPIVGNTAQVIDVSIPGDLNDSNQGRCWMWQAEKWIIGADGTLKVPFFYDGTTTVRSNYAAPITYTADLVGLFTVPAVGATAVATFTNVTGLELNMVITHTPSGQYSVQGVAGMNVTLLNINATPGTVWTAPPDPTVPDRLSWIARGTQLPPGRMGTYGMGRIWMSLVDGKQFIAGDIVGGSSGTVANNFRDAVLQVTENSYLFGGGNFAVPGAYGDIRAMCFSETLDSSLGQGALQIFTPNQVFSCNTPVDRTTWQDLQNPILTESAKGGGGLSQWSTINSNSDIISRDLYGLRSLILTRREFNTWGNVPISREISPQLNRDSDSMLGYTSAVVFDNRHLLTTEGRIVEGRGITWSRLAVTNYDTISTLQGKAPAVYDSMYWQGLNVFQLIKGEFAGTERCFAFTLNDHTDTLELWEIMKSADNFVYDDIDTRPVWSFESPVLDFGQRDPRLRKRLRLGQSEIAVSDLRGKVSFQAYFRPDFWPCWVPWGAWEECARDNDSFPSSPSFRPNMGLPEPDPGWCDPVTNRPLREGYTFQVKLVVTGQCIVNSCKFTADTVPEPAIAPPTCTAICPTP